MKDKQTPQLIVLGILIAVCVAFLVCKMTGGKKVTKAAASAKAQTQQKAAYDPGMAGDDNTAVAETDSSEPAVVAVQVASSTQMVRRDPFMPAIVATWKNTTYSPPPKPAMQIAQNNSLRFQEEVSPLPVLPFGSGPQQAVAQAMPVRQTPDEPEEKEFPRFDLTGVITGRTNVAIIRLGENRYIVKEGQLINGIYKVISVSQDGVQLSRDGRSVFLKLGGEGNAS